MNGNVYNVFVIFSRIFFSQEFVRSGHNEFVFEYIKVVFMILHKRTNVTMTMVCITGTPKNEN